MKLIVTHRAPDVDAITAVWILKRFDPQNYTDAKVAFVDAGSTISEETAHQFGVNLSDVIHVDTGLGEFDHHQKDRGMLRISAASLVFDLVKKFHSSLADNWALQQVVEYALQDDHFEEYYWPEAGNPRYVFMLRGILHGLEFQQMHDDDSQVVFGMRCLDGIYGSLQEYDRSQQQLKKGIEFQSKWGKGIAIATANRGAIKFAQLNGYDLVIQKDPKQGGMSIKAAPKPEIDLTSLYEKILSVDKDGFWFFHAGRHMIINNSSKATQRPTSLTIEQAIALAKES